MSIVVVGSSNTDMMVEVDQLPRAGETVLGGRFSMQQGGKGANQAVAAARLGGSVAFVAKIGSDAFGAASLHQYQLEKIDVGQVTKHPTAPSGVALITVDSKAENCITVAPGANHCLRVRDVKNARELFAHCDIVLISFEIPLDVVLFTAKLASEVYKKRVVFNPAPARKLPDELFSYLYLIVLNEGEAQIVSGGKTGVEAARRIPVENVVITRGAQGALLVSDDVVTEVPGKAVAKAVDTTGAGDTFCGAICVALAEGKSMVDATVFANACAALSVTKRGAQASIPFRRDLSL